MKVIVFVSLSIIMLQEHLTAQEVFVKVYPSEKTVYYGSAFQADIIILPQNKALSPKIFIGEKQIRIEKGIGKFSETAILPTDKNDLSFINKNKKTVQTGFKNGLYTKKLDGYIIYLSPSKSKQKINFSFNYNIVRPQTSIDLAPVVSLFNRCANKIQLQPFIPIKFKTKKGIKTIEPTVSATNANVKIDNANEGIISIIPNIIYSEDKKVGEQSVSKKVKLKVSYDTPDGQYILDEHQFNVRKIPIPHLDLINENNMHINIRKGLYWENISTLKLHTEKDISFRKMLPNEKQYTAKQIVIQLLHDDYSVGKELYKGNILKSFNPKDLAGTVEIEKFSFLSIKATEWVRTDALGKEQIYTGPSKPTVVRIK